MITIKDMPVEKKDLLKKRQYYYDPLANCINMIKGSFKARAYGNAINSLKMVTDDSELTDENLMKMNGVGQSLLTKIKEIMSTGTCSLYEKVKKRRL